MTGKHRNQGSRTLSAASVTSLLQEWRNGNAEAMNQVISLVYHDLKRSAHIWLKDEAHAHTLQPTALVHEVYVHLMKSPRLVFHDRTHFFRCACLIMRQISLKYARSRMALKRGGDDRDHLPLDRERAVGPVQDPDLILAVHAALAKVQDADPRLRQVVELRFFLGLNIEEIAEVLRLSTRTVRREWQTAKVWLAHELKSGK